VDDDFGLSETERRRRTYQNGGVGKMMISRIQNEKYFLSLDISIDHARRDAFFTVEKGEYNISGSYKKYTYSTGKAAFRKFDHLEKLLFAIHGIK
jgi:hypothetical protein